MENYFDFWNHEENKLVKEKKFFAIVVNFSEYNVSNYIYEYDPMLAELLVLPVGDNTVRLYDNYTPVPFCVNKRYVLLRHNDNEIKVMGDYDTKQEAIDIRVNDRYEISYGVETSDDYGYTSDEWPSYVVVDLAYTKPYFFKLSPSLVPKKNPGLFYFL